MLSDGSTVLSPDAIFICLSVASKVNWPIAGATYFLISNVVFAIESVAPVPDTAPALTSTLTLFKSLCIDWLAVPDTVIVIVFADLFPTAV